MYSITNKEYTSTLSLKRGTSNKMDSIVQLTPSKDTAKDKKEEGPPSFFIEANFTIL